MLGLLALMVGLLCSCAFAEVTIRLASWGTSDFLVDAAREAVAPYGIKIEFEKISSSSYLDKVVSSTLGGVGPDVIADLPYRFSLLTAGIITDLTPYLEKDPEVNFKSFYPAIWGMYTYAGGTWILPSVISPYLIFYNKQHLNSAGLAAPNENWRWTVELPEAANKLKVVQSDGKVTRYGLLLENRLYTPIFSAGGDILNAENNRAVIDSPAVANILKVFQEWRLKDLIPPLGDHRRNFAAEFGSIQAVLGTFGFNSYTNTSYANPAVEWGIAPAPLGEAGRSLDENTWGYSISAFTKHPDEAWIVAKALASLKGSLLLRDGQLSPMIGKMDNSAVTAAMEMYRLSREEVLMAFQQVNYVRPSFRHIKGDEIKDIVNKAFSRIVNGGESVGTVLPAAQESINALLNED
ncbi:MAG TPA: extracellular solute-binding protein [Firmicutes bacterium]|nr:extracellular solute-binding protein [Bacillota bacterium]